MNIKSLKKQSSKIFSAAIVALLIFSIIFLWTGERESSQAAQPMFAGVRFEGEYKIGEGEWRPITAGEHIPADEGDVTLRGIFVMLNPETGEPIGPLSAGSSVNLYFNHIGGTAILPGGGKFVFDAENEDLGEDACAIMWGSVPATGENPITIILHNPHKFGNHYAIDDFFKHMSIFLGIYWEHMELEKGAPERTVGILIFITSVVIIGIAVFSTIIHIKHSKVIWMMGLMSFFAGGYFIFSAFAVNIWNDSNIFNTRALGLCIMLYLLSSTILIVTQLDGLKKKVGGIAVFISALTMLFCIAISFSDKVKFFDTWSRWAMLESVVALILIVCQITSFRKSTNSANFFYAAGIIFLTSFLLDFVAIGLGWWEDGSLSLSYSSWRSSPSCASFPLRSTMPPKHASWRRRSRRSSLSFRKAASPLCFPKCSRTSFSIRSIPSITFAILIRRSRGARSIPSQNISVPISTIWTAVK